MMLDYNGPDPSRQRKGTCMEIPPPVWQPTEEEIDATNITRALRRRDLPDYRAFHRWSAQHPAEFWQDVIETLGIVLRVPPASVVNLTGGPTRPDWLPGAKLNIAESCFKNDPGDPAIIYQLEGGSIAQMSYGELAALSNRVANSLAAIGVGRGDAVAIAMPMTVEAVAAYIGIVKAGAAVVSVADSFAADEIATRLRIADARAAVTSDVIHRAGKTLPMYQKVADAGAERIVVIPAGEQLDVDLRPSDIRWSDFLSENEEFDAVPGAPADTTNILFSSGTTGDPKAIPWSHTTPIKCAMDGYYHHDIRAGEVVAWPTNLGWMMGPWLIYASLVNRGTMALYYGAPNTREFCEFVQNARVQMLGVVPSLVKAWRAGGLTDGLDWSDIVCYSSTGEPSNADDMQWLMDQAGNRPVVEYCGGTEIGGGFITQTLVQGAYPSTFSTPSLGLNIAILDEDGKPSDNGEIFVVPPSMGLSLTLLNRDHDEVYYRDTPKGPDGEQLRRHGDQMERLPGGYYRIHGRTDDTMNLGGIKVSSAEIERTVNQIDGVRETAAIAVEPPGGGPSMLVIYTVLEEGSDEPKDLKKTMQKEIAAHLNPLFRIHDVVVTEALPRTASNKVMRRVLRDQYEV